MYYYRFKDDSELTRDNVVKTLESLGYKKSEHSCNLKDAKGIALCYHCADSKGNIIKEKNIFSCLKI